MVSTGHGPLNLFPFRKKRGESCRENACRAFGFVASSPCFVVSTMDPSEPPYPVGPCAGVGPWILEGGVAGVLRGYVMLPRPPLKSETTLVKQN